jgi:hypothetical protein
MKSFQEYINEQMKDLGSNHPAGHYLVHSVDNGTFTRGKSTIVKKFKDQAEAVAHKGYTGANTEHDILHHDGNGKWSRTHHATREPIVK